MSIKQVFGEHARKNSGKRTKGYTAHPLGATGAIEAAICALALDRQWLPPTIKLSKIPIRCDLNVVPITDALRS